MKIRTALFLMLFLVAVGGLAFGESFPHKVTGSVILSDTSQDQLYRLTDFNLDGDFNDPGECILYYDGVPDGRTNPIKIDSDRLGNVIVSDTTLDDIIVLKDMNGDGDAMDSGELTVYIDQTNASGVIFGSIQGITTDLNGDLYFVNASSTGFTDFVARATDLNSDGDCQDAGEIVVLYDSVVADGLGVPIILAVPATCALAKDGSILVADVNDPNGNDPILRMIDLNGDDDMYDTDEVTYWYDDTIGNYDLSYVGGMPEVAEKFLLLTDFTADIVYLGVDWNEDGDILDLDEMTIVRDGTGTPYPDFPYTTARAGVNSIHWDIFLTEGGSSSGAPDGLHGMRDLNNDLDCDDADELVQVYDDTLGDLGMSLIKGIAMLKGPYLTLEGTPQIGSTVDFVVDGTVGDECQIAWSFFDAYYPVPPIGILQIGQPRHVIFQGTIGADGYATQSVTIPNNPSLVGYMVRAQSLAGDAYLKVLSNLLVFNIQ